MKMGISDFEIEDTFKINDYALRRLENYESRELLISDRMTEEEVN